MLAYAYSM